MNGQSNFADKAPELVQLDAEWVDDDKVKEKDDLKIQADNQDDYKTHYTSFAQDEKANEDEAERVRRKNGESNFADKAPESNQFTLTEFVDDDKVKDKDEIKISEDNKDDYKVHYTSFA